jgi:hypothetical protein
MKDIQSGERSLGAHQSKCDIYVSTVHMPSEEKITL